MLGYMPWRGHMDDSLDRTICPKFVSQIDESELKGFR